MLKIQIHFTGNSFLVYDQDRALKMAYASFEDPGSTLLDAGTVSKLREACKTQGAVYGGQKVYVWAKRTGDWEVSITLDKFPKQTSIAW